MHLYIYLYIYMYICCRPTKICKGIERQMYKCTLQNKNAL